MFSTSFRRNRRIQFILRLVATFTILCFLPMALSAPVQAAVNQENKTTKDHHVRGFASIDPTTLVGKIKLAYLNSKAAEQAREAPIAPMLAKPAIRTLMDETGQTIRSTTAQDFRSWQTELATGHPPVNRVAQLRIWIGEYLLAQDKEPEPAISQFDAARALVHHTGVLNGLASYDKAVALYWDGDYYGATDAFAYLIKPSTDKRGYSWANAAMWFRHASACGGYHNVHEAMGIPEPVKLDPFCLAAALAASLRSLGLPYDKKTVVASCHVSGEGSSLHDALVAGPKLGVDVRAVSANDKGLIALPKPIIAFVEHDHFISVVGANKGGVTYLCSDCGPWPGGQVTLTWKQWHSMNAGLYATVTRPGSLWDKALTAAIAGRKTPRLQVASAGSLNEITSMAQAMQAIEGNVVGTHGDGAQCTIIVNAMQCAYENCGCHRGGPAPAVAASSSDNAGAPPTGSGNGGSPSAQLGTDSGPSAGDPVDLATLEESYRPATDLTVYNPTGPAVNWQRIYDHLRGDTPYESTDFGQGWSTSYNITVYDPSISTYATVSQGSTGPTIASNSIGSSMTYSWEITLGGSMVANSSSAGGWNVTYSTSGLTITAPSTATVALGYEAIYKNGSNYSALEGWPEWLSLEDAL